MQKPTCVMLLSDKSSGSSILQSELASHSQINLIEFTKHNEQETLYWNKAAAVLDRPQVNMLNSELPIQADKARLQLKEFLSRNLTDYKAPNDDYALVMQGWQKLCQEYGPVFLEKTPHHLHYWSALELIDECKRLSSEKVSFKFIGLVRNPMDTLYSMWTRWRVVPELQQFEWLRAYQNLYKFSERVGSDLRMVRYEELMRNPEMIQNLCEFIDVDWNSNIGKNFRSSSIKKWLSDELFGFQLSSDVQEFAEKIGYAPEELNNNMVSVWPYYRDLKVVSRKVFKLVPNIKNKFKKLI